LKVRPVGADLFHADSLTDGWMDTHDMANSHLS
jgi:hypothetical protein